jgi:hypothetical protein
MIGAAQELEGTSVQQGTFIWISATPVSANVYPSIKHTAPAPTNYELIHLISFNIDGR